MNELSREQQLNVLVCICAL